MARKPRPRTNARDMTRAHLLQLSCGCDFFDAGFGDDLDAMRDAWQSPSVQEQVRRLAAEKKAGDRKPWAQIAFDELNIFGADGLAESKRVYSEQRGP